ncbi:c-type cytochrome [Paenibacillus sp. GCM10023248]|uniref:c-type cytochrome n=1 Tax=Bacillales TaxID=1385 RepID=UPI002378653E|nr:MULTISPECIES: cytochrome c [Bacillales]MDD9272300.1 cytochrome c [Paenibacillus sp. MAHUQ-63]MDR6883225.1 mono/diheme cytochrome c family protein [Bacillus sp. 3255]
MKKTLIVLTLLLAGSLAACGKKETPPATSPAATATTSPAATQSTAGTKADAQTVFKANCVSCHGGNLEGAVGPNLQKVGGKLSKDQITGIITNGKGAMPSFKGRLSDDEISAVATWLADKK